MSTRRVPMRSITTPTRGTESAISNEWVVAARTWVSTNSEGGRNALLHRLGYAFDAIPESLSLSGTGESQERAASP